MLALLCAFSVLAMIPTQEAEAATSTKTSITLSWTAQAGNCVYVGNTCSNYKSTAVPSPRAPITVSYKITGKSASAKAAMQKVDSIQVIVTNTKTQEDVVTKTVKAGSVKAIKGEPGYQITGDITLNTKYFNRTYKINVRLKDKNGKVISANVNVNTENRYKTITTKKFVFTRDSAFFISKVKTENGKLYAYYTCYSTKCGNPSVKIKSKDGKTEYGYCYNASNVFYSKVIASSPWKVGGKTIYKGAFGYNTYYGKVQIDYNTVDTIYAQLNITGDGESKTLKSQEYTLK